MEIPAIISQFQPRYGTDFTVGDLARRVADGDPGCEVVLSDAAELIGQALSAVHTIFGMNASALGAVGLVLTELPSHAAVPN